MKKKKVREVLYQDWLSSSIDFNLLKDPRTKDQSYYEKQRQFLEGLKHPQASLLEFTPDTDVYGDPTNIQATIYIEREETDEEYKKRLELATKRKASSEKRRKEKDRKKLEEERKEYLRLKKKFESNGNE